MSYSPYFVGEDKSSKPRVPAAKQTKPLSFSKALFKNLGWLLIQISYAMVHLRYLAEAFYLMLPIAGLLLAYGFCKITGIGANFADKCLQRIWNIISNDIKLRTVGDLLGSVVFYGLLLTNLVSLPTLLFISFAARANNLAMAFVGSLIPAIWNNYIKNILTTIGLGDAFKSPKSGFAEADKNYWTDDKKKDYEAKGFGGLASIIFGSAAVSHEFDNSLGGAILAGVGMTVGESMLHLYESFNKDSSKRADSVAADEQSIGCASPAPYV